MAAGLGNVKVVLSDADFQKELIVAGDKLLVAAFCAAGYVYVGVSADIFVAGVSTEFF